jgi:hypothetical protein
LVIDGVDYDNPTGFAFNANNYWTLSIQFGGGPTVAASVNTQAVSLPVDTYVALALNSTKANLIVPPGNALTLAITKTGSPANLPVGSGLIHGHYV